MHLAWYMFTAAESSAVSCIALHCEMTPIACFSLPTHGHCHPDCPVADCRRDAAPVREEIFEIGNEGMSVAELSLRLALPTGDIVKTLFMKGIMVQVNQVRKHKKAGTLGASSVTSHERV